MQENTIDLPGQWDLGMRMPTDDWLRLNGDLALVRPELRRHLAPLPPPELMQIVAGTASESAFAAHGVTIYQAVQDASPKPLADYRSILDFGCGCGRLARMFKGYSGRLTGCDIDGRHVDWINAHLSYMTAVQTRPNDALPFADAAFDAVISVSVFSHLDEQSQRLNLAELARVSASGAHLFLTIHGHRALTRALEDTQLFAVINISRPDLEAAASRMREDRYAFILQPHVHLTTDDYQYGITFIPESYIRSVWGEFFEIVSVVRGAIHDFQDIVVCRKR